MDDNLRGDNKKKVVEFNKRSDKYKFFHESIKVKKTLMNDRELIEERTLVMLEQAENGIKKRIVHPITEFIHRPLKRVGIPDIKTQSQIANYLINFLNFILIEKHHIYMLNSISELTFEHGTEYLTAYGQTGRQKNCTSIQKGTVKRCEGYLTQLYYFLAKKNVLKYITLKDFEFKEFTYEDLSLNRVPESPFYGVVYPDNNSNIEKNLIHDIPKELIILFIQTALSYTPRIALGVAFQCFGGLRVGEVVNISTTGITPSGEFGRYGFKVKLQKRNFRPELKSISGRGTPKKIRRQGIFPFNGKLLQILYKNHIENYIATDGSNALFGNANGKAMEKFSYQYYFEKLKRKFIELLGGSESSLVRNYAIELSSAKWDTHICRGIFSNLIAEDAENVLQVMSARADKDPLASLPYLNGTKKMLDILKNNYNNMYVELLETKDEILQERENNNHKGEK
ncbi:hypothetical protein RGU12_10540 [Fredinandcohnia sp. QZ13]|uniref:hypothetical protein n=1 Tax=Fredinandcohnia sp. QZ13 TaxID=3073144 RepID=UPI002853141E|nr:hypothetical protein [Fredinandcohnia sp. QZ13]MDR4887986.1 hypothetical protein [Fredinandcohnia sp. QZ13]